MVDATAAVGTATQQALSQSASTGSGTAISSDFETFLKMLTVQMQNQDPLNPIESSDYAVQLATFSGVEQQVLTNDLLTSLGAQLSASGMADMASWVGMEARAVASAQFDGTNPVTLAPNPVAVADRAEVVVRDAWGTEVQRFEISVTDDTIEWDGTTGSGTPWINIDLRTMKPLEKFLHEDLFWRREEADKAAHACRKALWPDCE